jgi:glycosyltransferase involved in cell wall biosynthesis
MSPPRITVLLAVYNGGPLLGDALASVLAQTYADFELLVIDDGSMDDTPARLRAVRDPRLRVLRNPENLGLTRSLNRGLHEARGAWIARHDADDLSAPTRLAEQWAFIERHPATVLAGTWARRIDPEGRPCGTHDLPQTHDAIRWASLLDNPFLHTSVFFSKATALDLGGYDERFAVCQDYDLWNRMAGAHPVANLPRRLVAMREHPASMTRTDATRTDRECRLILGEHLPRLFPGRTFSPQEAELLASYRLRFDASRLGPLERLIAGLLEDFQARHPGTRDCPDFKAVRCRQVLRLAYKFLRAAPVVALPRLFQAFRIAPGEALRQAALVLPRIGLPFKKTRAAP